MHPLVRLALLLVLAAPLPGGRAQTAPDGWELASSPTDCPAAPIELSSCLQDVEEWDREPWIRSESEPLISDCAGGGDRRVFHCRFKGRAYYLNDQRIQFTGQETTFGVEGVLAAGIAQQAGDWQYGVETELFLNQPFDRNVLVDTPLRRSFARNYDIDILQISQLNIAVRKGDVLVRAGRFVTPFGRFYYPTYFNNFWDSPFIRSEAIAYRETGAMAQWDPEPFVITGAVTNGGFERDTNSSKALLGRIGVEQPQYACGASIKWQDGVGSEHHKTYNNHIGLDGMLRRGRWTLSAEAIYDEYGLRRSGLDPNDIFWGRSLYFRELNNAPFEPLSGFGYYVDLGYAGQHWSCNLNYGDYFPLQEKGIPAHDDGVHRLLIHVAWQPLPHLSVYGIALLENDAPIPPVFTRNGSVLACGVQVTL